MPRSARRRVCDAVRERLCAGQYEQSSIGRRPRITGILPVLLGYRARRLCRYGSPDGVAVTSPGDVVTRLMYADRRRWEPVHQPTRALPRRRHCWFDGWFDFHLEIRNLGQRQPSHERCSCSSACSWASVGDRCDRSIGYESSGGRLLCCWAFHVGVVVAVRIE